MIRKYYNLSTRLLFQDKDTRSRKTRLWKGGSFGTWDPWLYQRKPSTGGGRVKVWQKSSIWHQPMHPQVPQVWSWPTFQAASKQTFLIWSQLWFSTRWFEDQRYVGPLTHLPRASENGVWEPCHRVSLQGQAQGQFPRQVCAKVLAWELWPVRSLCCCCRHCRCFKWVPEIHFLLRAGLYLFSNTHIRAEYKVPQNTKCNSKKLPGTPAWEAGTRRLVTFQASQD